MSKRKPVKVGLIGSGEISGIYLKNMTQMFSILEVVGCSDLIGERSRRRAEEFSIRQMTNEEILSDPEIQIVVNTTYPLSHYEVSRAALLAGKHVYSEKMMAVTMDEARSLMELARSRNLRMSFAPDTFLGAGLQTARKLIDDGMIGEPVCATAMVIRGYLPEGEDDDGVPFIMAPGGGIPYDMGGYYLHGLINLLGPVSRVTGFSRTRHPVERHRNPRHPRYGEQFPFDTPNMMAGALEFEQGSYATFMAVSEGYGETPRLEIYGTKGILVCGDPNSFGSPVQLGRINPEGDAAKRYDVPFTHGYAMNSRGIGVADMAWAISNNRPHRCSAELGMHAFEIVCGITVSGESGAVYEMTTRCERPAALPAGFVSGTAAEACLDN